MIRLFFMILFVAHIFAICFIGIARLEIHQNEGARTWMTSVGRDLQDESWESIYSWAIYWSVATMTTVGYGDIGAKSPIEALYVSCALLISCGFFSYTFGLIGMLIKDLNEQDVEFTQEMRVLNRYFNE